VTPEPAAPNRRVLVIDDQAELHAVFRRLLVPRRSPAALAQLEGALFGPGAAPPAATAFEVDAALQGEAGVALARGALAAGRPYALAFVDMRMPPGWDGLQTIEALRIDDPDLEIVICTAFSDLTEAEISARLGGARPVTFLRKPFDAVEVRRLARDLTDAWSLRIHAAR
jgi:two-component system NtrC family sensor kinase